VTEHDDAVRRLLADARHTEPMPADVAARLDGVLAELGAERAGASSPAPADTADPAPLGEPDSRSRAGRRTRRRAWVLAAAVAVIVAAGGVPAIDALRSGGSGGESASSDAGVMSVPEERKGPSAAMEPASDLDAVFAAYGAQPVSPATFDSDVARLAERRWSVTGRALPSGPTVSFGCGPADWGPGTLVPVEYAGQRAVLALRPPEGGHRTADLLDCDGAMIRSTQVD